MKNIIYTIAVFGLLFVLILFGTFVFRKMHGLDILDNADQGINGGLHKIIDKIQHSTPNNNESEYTNNKHISFIENDRYKKNIVYAALDDSVNSMAVKKVLFVASSDDFGKADEEIQDSVIERAKDSIIDNTEKIVNAGVKALDNKSDDNQSAVDNESSFFTPNDNMTRFINDLDVKIEKVFNSDAVKNAAEKTKQTIIELFKSEDNKSK